MVTCDESNNPPSVRAEGQLRARFYIQFEDQYTGEHYVFTLPIDLKSLREGTLTSVPVEHLR